MKGIDDYKFGRKNNWRRQVWNEMKCRVENPRDARILYLAGEQNLDAEVASQKGFRKKNMIAVEFDEDRAKALRNKKITTINANLCDVLQNWPINHKVDVVVADFCFGLTDDSLRLYEGLMRLPFMESHAVINLQRGRDAFSNDIRAAQDVFIKQAIGASPKHRGAYWLLSNVQNTLYSMITGKPYCDGMAIFHNLENDPVLTDLTKRVLKLHAPKYMSYKGGRVYMDSVIVSSQLRNRSETEKKTIHDERDNLMEDDQRNDCLKRKCIAAIAVQSRRKDCKK